MNFFPNLHLDAKFQQQKLVGFWVKVRVEWGEKGQENGSNSRLRFEISH